MAPISFSLLLVLVLFLSPLASSNHTYIVFMNPSHRQPSLHPTPSHWYHAHLQSLSIDPHRHLLYSYSHSLHGFSAHLLPHHLPALRSSPSVLSVLPDPLYSLHTTRSPHFLHLPSLAPTPSPSNSPPRDVIVGVLDTGVWPELPSFHDAGLAPVPPRWKGECEAGVDFSPSLCNRKLIGARSFSRGFQAAAEAAGKEYASPRDRDGHGTHTASTATGAPVSNASLFGYAPGTARGMAPGSRIAAYKVCWSSGCRGSDILAGIDSAISDGVDVLSLSLGGGNLPYNHDPIAVGTFAAVQSGIFVACSAGNSGPGRATLTNTAPWIATIGAGTLDRDFPAFAVLGNGQTIIGVSLYSGRGTRKSLVPIVYGRGQQSGNNSSKLCLPGTLDPKLVKGKVVLCDRGINARVEKGLVVKDAGGIGMLLANTAASGEELVADSHLLPAVAVGMKEGDRIREYVVSDPKPMALLSFGGTVLNVRPSPVVAAFSSRGPNTVVPEILKPDLVGPGVNILAGWSGSIGPTGLAKDNRRSQFNIMSGTSMSCPHISGVAALLKTAHPDWSPAAIKSALMTTSYTVDNTGSSLHDAAGGSLATPMAYGSGHVDPQKALAPGLVYDATTQDYIAFLCATGSTAEQVQAISKNPNATCSQKLSNPGNLNYPSFSVVFTRKHPRVKYSRKLTNVGPAGSSYSVNYTVPAGVSMSVKPKKLMFRAVGDKLTYSVTFSSKKGGVSSDTTEAFGWLEWSNADHRVRSPISYSWRAL